MLILPRQTRQRNPTSATFHGLQDFCNTPKAAWGFLRFYPFGVRAPTGGSFYPPSAGHFLGDLFEQRTVNAPLPMAHNVEFIAFWLFPKRHQRASPGRERSRPGQGRAAKGLRRSCLCSSTAGYPFPGNWLKAKQINASNFAHLEQMPGVQERFERSG